MDMPRGWASRDRTKRRSGSRTLHIQGLFQKPDSSIGEDSGTSDDEQDRSPLQQGLRDPGGGGMEIVHLQVRDGKKSTGVHSRTQTRLFRQTRNRGGPCTSDRSEWELHQGSYRDQGSLVISHYQL